MKILAISGSLRRVSSNSTLLRAATLLAPEGMEITLFEGLGGLPHFNPDLEGTEPPSVPDFRARLQAADGVLICSPEYAHGVPGVLKNALDWVVGSGRTRCQVCRPVERLAPFHIRAGVLNRDTHDDGRAPCRRCLHRRSRFRFQPRRGGHCGPRRNCSHAQNSPPRACTNHQQTDIIYMQALRTLPSRIGCEALRTASFSLTKLLASVPTLGAKRLQDGNRSLFAPLYPTS